MSATHRDCLRVTNAKGCMKTTRLENVLLVRFLGPVMLPPLIISTSLTFSQPPALSLYNDRQIFTPPNQKCNLGVSIGLESNVAVEFTEYGGYLCQRKAVPSCLGLSPSYLTRLLFTLLAEARRFSHHTIRTVNGGYVMQGRSAGAGSRSSRLVSQYGHACAPGGVSSTIGYSSSINSSLPVSITLKISIDADSPSLM